MAKKPTQQFTIKMPKKSLKKWLSALRSGEYKRGTAALKDENGGYCCLGVLQQCLTGEVEKDQVIGVDGRTRVVPQGMPTLGWLKKHGIIFSHHLFLNNQDNPSLIIGTKENGTPIWSSAADANDEKVTIKGGKQRSKYTFKQIADFIEKHALGV